MKRKSLNDMNELLYGGLFSCGVQYRNSLIVDMGAPMNDILWWRNIRYEDKSISMEAMRYAKYQDLINQSIKPFKKR